MIAVPFKLSSQENMESSSKMTGDLLPFSTFMVDTGDGNTPDSDAIQKALDAAGAVSGTVYFPAGRYLCHDLKVHQHTTVMAEPQWGYRGDAGAMLIMDSDEADCMLNITGAYGVHLRGLFLQGRRNTKKATHGVFLNNTDKYSPKEDSIIIDDCKIAGFSGHGVHLLRIWLFIIRHSIMQNNRGCGVQITGWDGFVTDNQFSGNGSSEDSVVTAWAQQ